MNRDARILLVDDSEDSRLISLAALEDGAFGRIDAAPSAHDAYRLLDLDGDAEVPPSHDVILLDIVMPDIDGVEACARIRASRRYRDVPILMVSGQQDLETLNQAFVAGADDYVTKPIDPVEMIARVRSALRLKRERERRQARESELRARARQALTDSGGYGVDGESGLPDPGAMDLHLRAAADGETGTALLLVAIDRFAALRTEVGDAAAAGLSHRVARELARLPAPLGVTLGAYGDGLFLCVAPGQPADTLDSLAQAAHARLAAVALPHGGSADHDQVQLTSVTGEAAGERLLALPARMIAIVEQAMRDGGNQMIRIGEKP